MITLIGVMTILVLLVFWCIVRARRSNKPIAITVKKCLYSSLFPILFNVVMIGGQDIVLLKFAYVFYYMSLDVTFYYLLRFCFEFCGVEFNKLLIKKILWILVPADLIMLALNLVFENVFVVIRRYRVDGTIHYILHQKLLFKIHIAFLIVLITIILGVLIWKMITSSRLYLEKYLVIFITLLAAILYKFYHDFVDIPNDQSMIGIAACGIIIYYFSVEYVSVFLMDRMLSRIVYNVSDGILFFDENRNCIYVNDSAEKIFGQGLPDKDLMRGRIEELIGDENVWDKTKRFYEINPQWKKKRGIILESDEDYVKGLKPVLGENELSLEIEYRVVRDVRRNKVGSFFIIKNATDDMIDLERERHAATHDHLTGIYNPERFYERAQEVLRENPDEDYVLVGSDIKEFKLVNDIFGRAIGDKILIQIAESFKCLDSETAVYGRLGSDKFGVLIKKVNFEEQKFLDAIDLISKGSGDIYHPITIHLGVYDIVDRSLSVAGMMDRAFLAIASIKNDLHKKIAYYDEKIRGDILWEQKITGGLDRAVKTGQIVPYLQAQVTKEGKIIGAEALSRWNHPDEGFLKPNRYVPLLEKNGMIVKIDEYMWECCCKILKKWEKEGKENLKLSVNISPMDFYFIDVYEKIVELVDKYEVNRDSLRLEITESLFMQDSSNRMKLIQKFRDAGFTMEMDDFGSGYSSLNLLKDMPVDILKIDMVFLEETDNREKSEKILRTIVNLAKDLDITVITEGVETEENVKFLTSIDCDMFQGFYFSKPLSLEEFEKLVEEHS